MNVPSPGAPKRLTFSRPLTFERAEWITLKLRVVLIDGAPWFVGADVLALLGRAPAAQGNVYARMPPGHQRRVLRKRLGLRGSGPAEAVLVSLPGVRRLLRLAMASPEGAEVVARFEVVLREEIMPEVEATLGAGGLWTGTPVPSPEETVEEKLARLARIDREYMSVATFARAREFNLTPQECRDLGNWAIAHCRVERVAVTRSTPGVCEYPRRVLDAGARAMGLGAP